MGEVLYIAYHWTRLVKTNTNHNDTILEALALFVHKILAKTYIDLTWPLLIPSWRSTTNQENLIIYRWKGTISKFSHRVNKRGHELYLTSGHRYKKSRNMFYKTRWTEYIFKVLVKSVKNCATCMPLKKTKKIWPWLCRVFLTWWPDPRSHWPKDFSLCIKIAS